MIDPGYLGPMISDIKTKSNDLKTTMTDFVKNQTNDKQQILTELKNIYKLFDQITPSLNNDLTKCQEQLKQEEER